MFEDSFLEKISELRVLIVGDVMLDRYWWGSVNRISPEAPVPIVNLEKISLTAGGAANVAANIAGLGAKPFLVGIVGIDEEAKLLREVLESKAISAEFLSDIPNRKTTVKTRIVAHNQQVARIDQESKNNLTVAEEESIWNLIEKLSAEVQVIIISDYGKGFISNSLCQRLIKFAGIVGKSVIIDPKGKNYQKYRGATLLTPNRSEVSEVFQLTDFTQTTIENAGSRMIDEYDLEAMLITQGEDGMTLFERNGKTEHLRVTARNVYDVTGAGDTVIACLACASGIGETLSNAAKFANIAAGLVVEKVGTTAITKAMLRSSVQN